LETEIQGVRLISIPGGTFQMGSNFEDDAQNPDIGKGYFIDEKPVHNVTLNGFDMSIYEVTQGQYQSLMGSNPSSSYGVGGNYPVYNVSWYDAVKFCNKLSVAAGFDKCYDERVWACDFSKNGFRLPTEAEWEYAYRAGTTTNLCPGDDAGETKDLRPGLDTHPVGRKIPNTWGLYDMYGNVFEWCNDWYKDSYTSDSVTDPKGVQTGSSRVLRGSSVRYDDYSCRSSNRNSSTPGYLNYHIGFRIVRRAR